MITGGPIDKPLNLFETEEYTRACKLREISKHPGVEALKDLIREAQRRIGEAALDDKERPRSWWQGYRAGIGLAADLITEMTRLANDLDASRAIEAKVKSGVENLLARTLKGGEDL